MNPDDEELRNPREGFSEPAPAFRLELAPFWLRKQGEKGLRTWKRRYFVVRDAQKLLYFRSDTETVRARRGGGERARKRFFHGHPCTGSHGVHSVRGHPSR